MHYGKRKHHASLRTKFSLIQATTTKIHPRGYHTYSVAPLPHQKLREDIFEADAPDLVEVLNVNGPRQAKQRKQLHPDQHARR